MDAAMDAARDAMVPCGCLRWACSTSGARLPALATVPLVLGLLALGLVGPGGAAPDAPAPKAPWADKLTLKDGKSVEGEVRDITEKKVTIAVGKETRTFPRKDVTAIQRAAPEKTLALFQRKFDGLKKEAKVEDWKGLAKFCQTERLHPERRKALREVLRLDAENAEARTELGHARLEGKWLDEDEVAAKLKDGFEVKDGQLVKGTAVTAVKKTPADGAYRIVERKKMSESERKRLEKEREERLKSADKFLAMKEKEYEGVPWEKRHVIKTRFFEINCNSTESVARAYGALMEMIRDELSKIFKSEIKRNFRAPINIYASQEEFMKSDQLGRWMGRGLGGYYNPTSQSITAFHGTFGFTGTTFGVLCHEGTHYFQGLVLKEFDNIPMWLIEGLAVYFGDGSIFDPKAKKITVGKIPRDRLAHIQEKMLIKRHTPIAKLVTMTRRDGFSGSHYADAWSLIYFLVNSGDKGKKLLTEYWAIGLEQPLKKEHFTKLAEKYFGSLQAVEKEWVDYTLKLEMPPAGKVIGDYFVSDTFQFDYKAPAENWEFFEDKEDKKMLTGVLLPGTSAEIRVYYENNTENAEPDAYFEGVLRASSRFSGLKHEKVKSGKLDWFKMTYVDDGQSSPEASIVITQGEGGKIVVTDKSKDSPKKKKEPRDVVKYYLIQKDGVVAVECSAKLGEGAQYANVFDKAHEAFTMTFTRRW